MGKVGKLSALSRGTPSSQLIWPAQWLRFLWRLGWLRRQRRVASGLGLLARPNEVMSQAK